jgi:hypothetical protein
VAAVKKTTVRLDRTCVFLRTRECADFMGVTTDYIRSAIRAGDLEAEYCRRPGRRRGTHLIAFPAFVRFLRRCGVKRIPRGAF